MRALRLDFVRVRRPVSLLGLALFAAGTLTAAVILGEALDLREDIEQQVGQRALVERRMRAQRSLTAPALRPRPEEARALRDANQIIARQNAPWPRLLADTAAAAGSLKAGSGGAVAGSGSAVAGSGGAVALTGLNPDTMGRSVRIAGVAPDLAAVYAFVLRLQALPGFVQVHLAQHEAAREALGAARVGFVVVAHWKDEP